MTDEALLEVLAVFEGAYRVHYKASQVQTWAGLLGDVGDAEGRRAAYNMARRSEHLPSVAAFRGFVAEARDELRAQIGAAKELPAGETSLNPGEQLALLARMNSNLREMGAGGVPVEARAKILVAQTLDVVNEARRRHGRGPLGVNDER